MSSIESLQGELERHGVPESAYSLGNDSNESYCLIWQIDGWHVYYSERGGRNEEQVFASESAACDELFRRVINDETVRHWMDEHGL